MKKYTYDLVSLIIHRGILPSLFVFIHIYFFVWDTLDQLDHAESYITLHL